MFARLGSVFITIFMMLRNDIVCYAYSEAFSYSIRLFAGMTISCLDAFTSVSIERVPKFLHYSENIYFRKYVTRVIFYE